MPTHDSYGYSPRNGGNDRNTDVRSLLRADTVKHLGFHLPPWGREMREGRVGREAPSSSEEILEKKRAHVRTRFCSGNQGESEQGEGSKSRSFKSRIRAETRP